MEWTFGDFRLDTDRFELSLSGQAVQLEPQVLALLVHLVRNRDRMVTKEEIVKEVWQGRAVSDASISSRIRSARKAVGDDGTGQTLIRTIHGRGFRFVADVAESHSAKAFGPNLAAEQVASLTSRPSLAILPFRPLALPPELAILADAVPHEIIQALSRLRWLAVIARGSSFRFRQVHPDLDRVSSALGVRYVLSGVIETQGAGLAVTLELADCNCGEVIWGDRLFAPLDGIEDLRARIVTHLVSALEVYIPLNEAHAAKLCGADKLDAWANYHLGLQHLYRFTAFDNAQASGYFNRAVAMDPHFARAHAGLSFTSFLDAFLQLGPDVRVARQAARRHAEMGLELDPLDPFTNFTMGRYHWLTAEPEMAMDWLNRATKLNPNYAQGFYALAFTSMLLGDVPATAAGLDTALQLSPLDPLLYGFHGVRAQMLMQNGDYQAAALWSDRAASTPGAHYLIAMVALAANGLAGRHDRAAYWTYEVRRRKPDASAAQYFAAFPIRDGSFCSRIGVELRRHGF